MSNEFAPELVLEEEDRRELAITRAQPGFRVIQQIFKSAIDTFVLEMLNSQEDSEETLILHRSAKVAAKLYTMFIYRVNQEVEQYMHAPRSTDKPLDMTDVLDMGDVWREDSDTAEEL